MAPAKDDRNDHYLVGTSRSRMAAKLLVVGRSGQPYFGISKVVPTKFSRGLGQLNLATRLGSQILATPKVATVKS